MKLYFKTPAGERLAIDTERREWAADYANDDTELTDKHRYINVSSLQDLYTIESESDFNGYGYNSNIENGRAPGISVFTDYLQVLASYSAAADAGQLTPDNAGEFPGAVERIEKARAAGYFNAREYSILILLIDDITAALDLYARAKADD